MKVFLLTLFASIASLQWARAQSTKPLSPQEQELINLSRQKWDWMADKKVDTLAALFDDKAVFVHMGGSWGKTNDVLAFA